MSFDLSSFDRTRMLGGHIPPALFVLATVVPGEQTWAINAAAHYVPLWLKRLVEAVNYGARRMPPQDWSEFIQDLDKQLGQLIHAGFFEVALEMLAATEAMLLLIRPHQAPDELLTEEQVNRHNRNVTRTLRALRQALSLTAQGT